MPSPSSFFTVQPRDSARSAADDATAIEVPIEGAPIPLGGLQQLNARGRTFRSTLHPLLSEGQAWITEKLVNARSQSSFIECAIQGASTSLLPEELVLYSFDIPHQKLTPARLKFMEECSVVFEELQETHAQYTVPGYLNRFSKLYESHFEAFCAAMDAELNRNPPNAAEIEQDVSNISSAVTLIHLTQTIYFQPNPSAIMAEDLMHWVNRESGPDEIEGAEIMKTHPPCHHPSYWTFLHKAISRALFKVAISCLSAAGLPEYDGVDPTILSNIIQLLNAAPLGKQSQLARKANELWDLKNSWKSWHSSLEKIQIASIRNQSARTGLGVLLKILRGDRDTIAEISDSWQEYVASMAFFSKPFTLANYKDVQQLYDDAMDYGFNIDNTLPSEVASAALFTCDLPRALVNFFRTDITLAVHASDLLSKSGILDEFEEGDTLTLRDRFILDYGDLAICNPQTSYTAMVYWKSVPVQGVWRIEEAIVRIPLESQDQVDKLVDLCFDLHLDSQRSDICRGWARQLEHDNQAASALQYFEKGQSFADIERICWNILERMLLTGENRELMDLNLVEILENPPPSPMIGTLIAPLALLYNFFESKRKGNAAESVQYLSKLFRLSSMPREYISLLMAEMLPVLDEKRATTLGQKDLFEILAAVEDYVGNESTFQKGSDLLSRALRQSVRIDAPTPFQNWRELFPHECTPQEILALFRIKATTIIAHLYTTN